jgi:hypothetical protein
VLAHLRGMMQARVWQRRKLLRHVLPGGSLRVMVVAVAVVVVGVTLLVMRLVVLGAVLINRSLAAGNWGVEAWLVHGSWCR